MNRSALRNAISVPESTRRYHVREKQAGSAAAIAGSEMAESD
jgi:hypothetical protein